LGESGKNRLKKKKEMVEYEKGKEKKAGLEKVFSFIHFLPYLFGLSHLLPASMFYGCVLFLSVAS